MFIKTGPRNPVIIDKRMVDLLETLKRAVVADKIIGLSVYHDGL